MIFNSENEEITLQEKWAQDAESGMKITPPKKKAHDVDLRTGVKQCQWCSDDLTGDDVAEINGKVVCPSCAEGYRRGKDEEEFKESDHPRSDNGQFGNKHGGSAPSKQEKPGETSSKELPKPPKNTLQLKRMHQWAQEGNVKSIDKTIDFQNKELEKSGLSSEEREWRGQIKEYGEQLREHLGGTLSSLKPNEPATKNKSAQKVPAKELKPSPGEPVSQDSKGNGVKIERGTPIWHTSQSNLKSLKDQTMWFTPFQDEAEAFNRNIKQDFGHAKTFEMEWDGSPIATVDQAAAVAKEIWPDDDFIYSMFDEAVGDKDPKDIRRFIKAMEDRGYAGSMIEDYSAIDQQRNCDSLAVFHPDKHMSISKAKATDADQAGPGLEWQGLQVVVESPRGTKRNGATMPADYGYINGFNEGADGDRVDCYLAGDVPIAYVVDQLTDDQTAFDEHKCILGADSERAARKLYVAGHTKGKDLLGAITAMPAEVFKAWLKAGDTTQPVAWRPKQ